MSDLPTSDLPRSTRRCVEAAAVLGLVLDIHRFPAGTRTAVDAAAAIGCPVDAIAKSIVLTSDQGPVLVFTSGGNRVDHGLVAAALGITGVTRADAEQARAATGYAIGGTAPFGHPAPVPMLLDEDLLSFDEVWAAGGTPDTVFPISPQALMSATGARPARIAAEA